MIDFEKLRAVYRFSKNLSLQDIQVLIKSARTKKLAPSEYLIEEGSISKDVFLIRKGLVRAFLVNEKGEEITTMLRSEEQVVANPDSILFNQPSRFYYQTLEDSEFYLIDFDLLQSIIAKNPKLEANRKYILQNMLKEALTRIDSFVLLNPEERYLDFVKKNPDIVNRVPNKYIANVLGITPVSLSRIRARIASKKK